MAISYNFINKPILSIFMKTLVIALEIFAMTIFMVIPAAAIPVNFKCALLEIYLPTKYETTNHQEIYKFFYPNLPS